ncbi:MAG: hypothetical protein CBC48_08520 [bacterium TMED88]|nr:hypothetical protein [Deltaproteobacteria bacterium]OUV32253.1 MAG: hypothetical protein CBC48_08520 [bacterium TMED88]
MAETKTTTGAAWAKNAAVLAAMTLVGLCGYALWGPEAESPTRPVAAVAPPVVVEEPAPIPVETPLPVQPVEEPPPVVAVEEPVVLAPLVAAAAVPPAPAVVAPPAVVEPEPLVIPAVLPPVAAAGPMPEPSPDFLPLGPATDQFADPSPDVAMPLALNFNTGPGLPQIDDSQSIIQPCQAAASCAVDVPAAAGPIGLVVVGGGWPPPSP